jgi:NTE family protein
VGVVLGAGGVLGAAWIAGALEALESRLDRPLSEADLVVGTSAGSVVAAALRCGAPVESFLMHEHHTVPPFQGAVDGFDRESGPFPPMPRLRVGSLRLLGSAARAPHHMNPWAVASALLPQGRAHHDALTALLDAMLARADGYVTHGSRPWPRKPTWIMCLDYDSGRRVAFGRTDRTDAPTASLSDAVVASCSIPGWHQPAVIGGGHYVDGGVVSTTSLELIAETDLDEVFVLAPMASYHIDRPRNPATRAERLLRHFYTVQLTHEASKVRSAGIEVTLLTPGPEDLTAIGSNLMDPTRREHVVEVSRQTTSRQLARLLHAGGS